MTIGGDNKKTTPFVRVLVSIFVFRVMKAKWSLCGDDDGGGHWFHEGIETLIGSRTRNTEMKRTSNCFLSAVHELV